MAGLILYSFRRCPYAIRARLALRQAGITPELREVDLRCKPPELIAASAKTTVPVLVRPDGPPIDESLELMRWALAQNDPHGLLELAASPGSEQLLQQNDGPFKHHLDRYRYPHRYGGSEGMPIAGRRSSSCGSGMNACSRRDGYWVQLPRWWIWLCSPLCVSFAIAIRLVLRLSQACSPCRVGWISSSARPSWPRF